MKPKSILALILLVFVIASIAYMVGKERHNTPPVAENNNIVKEDINTKSQLIVYYLHGDRRCPTCHKLETYAKESLQTYFAAELDSNEIVWKVVNMDEPQNKHYIKDYKLVTKSIILSAMADGKEVEWKNLGQIWQKVGNKESYLQYIRDSIKQFLKESKL